MKLTSARLPSMLLQIKQNPIRSLFAFYSRCADPAGAAEPSAVPPATSDAHH